MKKLITIPIVIAFLSSAMVSWGSNYSATDSISPEKIIYAKILIATHTPNNNSSLLKMNQEGVQKIFNLIEEKIPKEYKLKRHPDIKYNLLVRRLFVEKWPDSSYVKKENLVGNTYVTKKGKIYFDSLKSVHKKELVVSSMDEEKGAMVLDILIFNDYSLTSTSLGYHTSIVHNDPHFHTTIKLKLRKKSDKLKSNWEKVKLKGKKNLDSLWKDVPNLAVN